MSNVGIYRDDRLATCTKTPEQIEAIKREICKIYKHNNLQITIDANKKYVDFLDITLGLRTAIFKPYKKTNSNLTIIHKQSNHPPSIIKNIPKSINNCLSINSKNAQIFNKACPLYTEALQKNGYNTNLQFDMVQNQKAVNYLLQPPLNISMATNVAKTLLTLEWQPLSQGQAKS